MTLAVRSIVPVTVYSQFDELKFLFGILIKQLETKHFQFQQTFQTELLNVPLKQIQTLNSKFVFLLFEFELYRSGKLV